MKKIKFLIAALAFVAGSVAFAQENIVAHGNMEDGASEKEWYEEGSTITLKKGKGVAGSTGLYVRGKYNWSGVGKDLTKLINAADGSSYYVEVWYMQDPADKGVRHSDISLCVQPSGVSEEDYDSFIYEGLDPMDSYTGSKVQLSNKEYVKVCGVISGESIKDQLKGRKAVQSILFFKTDNPIRPYYIDNVIVKKIK